MAKKTKQLSDGKKFLQMGKDFHEVTTGGKIIYVLGTISVVGFLLSTTLMIVGTAVAASET